MRLSKRLPIFAAVCLSGFWLLVSGLFIPLTAQPSDEAAALSALGPQWRDLSRRAGMIFAGTVITSNPLAPSTPAAKLQTAVVDLSAPAKVEIRFQVDEAIVGVKRGELLTIHEWAGAALQHPAFISGKHVLIFLYPASRLGLTSPVGGSRGLIALDSNGRSVSKQSNLAEGRPQKQSFALVEPADATDRVSVLQLERAIRNARKD